MEIINQNFLEHYQILIKLTCYSKVDCCDILSYKVDWLILHKHIFMVHFFEQLHLLNPCPPTKESLFVTSRSLISSVPNSSMLKKFFFFA